MLYVEGAGADHIVLEYCFPSAVSVGAFLFKVVPEIRDRYFNFVFVHKPGRGYPEEVCFEVAVELIADKEVVEELLCQGLLYHIFSDRHFYPLTRSSGLVAWLVPVP